VQYAQATMFITLLVLLCFNLLGEGFEVAMPRVLIRSSDAPSPGRR
jgi:uncharacterized membrane protein YccC